MNIISVSQLNAYLKEQMDQDPLLSALFVRGEISNYKAYPSGHHYFSLKDEGGAIRCVLFRREASALRFRPENGMNVIAFGRVTVFPRDGQYQLYCNKLTPDGVGDLHTAFEQLKERLYREGLFAASHKKPLPRYPERIVLVTSPAGAAVRDMLRILKARWPLAEVVILPVRVQGEEAAGEIAAAIQQANQSRLGDLILTGRGGGSIEDLWAFNEEAVARAIYSSEIPVISAVGHEPDVTIADFVADLRAATPSNAAELAVPDQQEERARLENLRVRLSRAVMGDLAGARAQLERLAKSRALTDPRSVLSDRRILLDYQREKLSLALRTTVEHRRSRLGALAASLDAMSPFKVLGRGYAMAQRRDGTLITKVNQTAAGMEFSLRLTDGSIPCRVEKGARFDD